MARKKEDQVVDDNTVYIFCGEGAGVPGLPHEISMAEAQALALDETLKAAIENGNYKIKEGA